MGLADTVYLVTRTGHAKSFFEKLLRLGIHEFLAMHGRSLRTRCFNGLLGGFENSQTRFTGKAKVGRSLLC